MPWAPSYASGAELQAWMGVDADPHHAIAVESASLAIDQSCGRQFGLLSSSEFRYYEPYWYRDRYWCDIDDVMTTNSLVIETENGDEITDYTLTPRNAAAEGKPWTRIEFARGATVTPTLKISARYGWSAVPNTVKMACLIQAARYYSRRKEENVGGMPTGVTVDDVRVGWASQREELDSDVASMLRPFRRLWGAA